MTISSVPDLQPNIPIVDPATGNPSTIFQRWWSDNIAQVVNGLVGAANAQIAADAANAAAAAATTAAATAQTAATTAQTAADTAQASTDSSARETSLNNSYVTGLTMTATDAGANVTVSISAHTRVYGDGTSVAVSAGSVTGLPYSTTERIFYDDPTRAGGAVTYQATTSTTAAAQTGDRHSVGAVTTPAALAAPVPGRGVTPPGYVEP